MAKQLSRYEQDQQRREGAKGGSQRRTWIIAAVAGIALVALIFTLRGDEPTPEGATENFAAFALDDDPYLGDPAAPVTIVAFESPSCSSCRSFHNSILPGIQERQLDTGRAVLYFLQAPLQQSYDLDVGIAQECVYQHGDLDAFWAFTDLVYGSQFLRLDARGALSQIATEYEIDRDALLNCYDDEDTEGRVLEDWDVMRNRGRQATPTFFVFGPEGEAFEVDRGGLEQAVADAMAVS